ncbi:hypothetical protein AB1Y20_023733 [Prymnesium parvum]|uniref:Cation/H+ exchanger transmembrane domain-containing protein n=1 Tax=Prymnesium parvum TaxID=97485 RepID=A0AB34JFE4_PRYPA
MEGDAPLLICSFACLLLLALLATELLHRRPRVSSLMSETTLLIAIGAVANLVYWAFTSLDGRGESLQVATSATMHDLIYFLMLPPIIFEAGYTMRKHRFFANLGTLLLYAIVGTGVSIAATGMLVYLLSSYGAIHTRLTTSQALLFGSLISSTDPIATISILRTSTAPPLLGDLIFGESALNDALSIVFFDLFRKRCQLECTSCHSHDSRRKHLELVRPAPPASPPPTTASTQSAILQVLGELALTFCGSLALGLAAGLMSALLFRRLGLVRKHRPSVELAMMICFLFGTFSLAELATLSGILTLFFTGIVTRHYASYNLSEPAKSAALVFVRTIASISEIGLALVMGMSMVDYATPHVVVVEPHDKTRMNTSWDLPFALLILPLLLVGRAINIFPLSLIANRFRTKSQRVTAPMQVVMWWSGLRGAVSFALAMTLDESRETQMVLRAGTAAPLVTTTLVAIVGSNLLLAPLTAPLIRWLRLDAPPAEHSVDPLLLAAAQSAVRGRRGGGGAHVIASASLEAISEVPADGRGEAEEAVEWVRHGDHTPAFKHYTSPVHRLWHHVDERYMKPIFGGRTHGAVSVPNTPSMTRPASWASLPSGASSSGQPPGRAANQHV